MFSSRFNPGDRPLFYLGALPVYVTTLLVGIHVTVMIALAAGGGAAALRAVELFGLDPGKVLGGRVWQLGTYAFVTLPSFGSALGLVFFFLFGSQVESHFGRKAFVKLYGALVLAPAALLVLCEVAATYGFQRPFLSRPMVGAWIVHACLFLAFAFVHPTAPFFFGFLAKWIATFFVAVDTLLLLFSRDWPGLLALWFSIVLTYGFLRREGLPCRFPGLEAGLARLLPKRRPRGYRHSRRRLAVVPREGSPPRAVTPPASRYPSRFQPRAEPPESGPEAEKVDRLLEKISREGIGSLSAEERRQLESASLDLARRGRKGP